MSEAINHKQQFAIVGMSGCFPGADNVDQLWQNLVAKKHAISEVPKERWDWQAHYADDEKTPGASYSKWAGMMNGVFDFDPLFFRISPAEAEYIDPQQRLVLEHSWKALECANITPSHLANTNTGVFVGACSTDYSLLTNTQLDKLNYFSGLGTNNSVIANRVSFAFDFHGPSITVDTACSSSLTALHLACQSLASQECDHALVAGVNVLLSPIQHITFSRGGAMARDGLCKVFDKSADGFVRGEGCGVIVVKHLQAALDNHDTILGVIAGSAINQDGLSNGISYPNPKAQEQVLMAAWQNAGISAADLSYIEAHGTGTFVGDPIEVGAIERAMQQSLESSLPSDNKANTPCYLGSIKANIGHLEPAAGIASIIKVLLSFKHQQWPPQCNLNHLNPKLTLEPFLSVNQTTVEWADSDIKTAAISGFSFAGANAHIVLHNKPVMDSLSHAKPTQAVNDNIPSLLVLSAKQKTVLATIAKQLLHFIEQQGETLEIVDLLHTLQQGREHFALRVATVIESREELLKRLSELANGNSEHFIAGRAPKNEMALELDALKNSDHAALAQLWVSGHRIDWSHSICKQGKLITIPSYPFNKRSYVFAAHERFCFSYPPRTTGLQGINCSTKDKGIFQRRLYSSEYFLNHHQLQGKPLLPAAATIEMVIANAQQYMPSAVFCLENVIFLRPLYVESAADIDVVFTEKSGQYRFSVESSGELGAQTQEKSTRFSKGKITGAASLDELNSSHTDQSVLPENVFPEAINIDHFVDSLQDKERKTIPIKDCYQQASEYGLHFGDRHRCVQQLSLGRDEGCEHSTDTSTGTFISAFIDNRSKALFDQDYRYPPDILDSVLQAAAFGTAASKQYVENKKPLLLLPFSAKSIVLNSPLSNKAYVAIKPIRNPASQQENKCVVDLSVYDCHGQCCMQIKQLTLVATSPSSE